MDYEKEYKEALERAKFYYGNCPSESEKKKLEKMFPELKESDDERIRKELLDAVDKARVFDIDKDVADRWTAWLEKQKEQQPAEWSEDYRGEDLRTRFAFYTYKDEDDALYLSNVFVEETSRNKGFGTKILAAAEKVAETIGVINIRLKVKQNSPANAWYRKHGYGYMAFEGDYDWLEKTLEYLKPINPEWSEFDKGALKDAICAADRLGNDESFNKSNPNLAKAYRVAKDWLKSLPERFTLQPEREVVNRTVFDRIADIIRWCDLPIGCPIEDFKQSESEREHLLHIVQCVAHRYANSCTYCKEYSRGYQDGLSVSHWKPSKQQMGTLKQWLQDHELDGDSRYVYPIFESLYHDLKAL